MTSRELLSAWKAILRLDTFRDTPPTLMPNITSAIDFAAAWTDCERKRCTDTHEFVRTEKFAMPAVTDPELKAFHEAQRQPLLAVQEDATFDSKDIAVQTRSVPYLDELAGGDARLGYRASFARQVFSHFYIAKRLDEFADKFFPLIRFGDGRNRELDYAVLSDDTRVFVFSSDAIIRCFLCFLAIDTFQFSHAKCDFLSAHLPVTEFPLLSLAMVMSTMCTPKHLNTKDIKPFQDFVRGTNIDRLPDSFVCKSGKMSTEARTMEIPLLLELYARQKHPHDITNCVKGHKFQLGEDDKRIKGLADQILVMASICP
jgi:hypothetical protein